MKIKLFKRELVADGYFSNGITKTRQETNEELETRVNEFMADKKVSSVQAYGDNIMVIVMLYYDELKETIDRGFIKGDTIQIVRKNGKIHDYVLDGEQVEPHKTLSLEKVSDIIKELADELGVSKTYIEKIIRVVYIHSELLKKE